MGILEALIFGLVQGLTEFIPVSSSGHLLLLHHAFGIQEQGLAFDVALHIGTLAALLLFFYRDIVELIKSTRARGPKRRLLITLAVATVPAVLVGILLQDLAATTFRSPILVSLSLAALAVLMLVAEKYGSTNIHNVDKINQKQGFLIGLAQAVALVPGVSRSGSTITAGLFLGLDRVAATRFSFLLSIPITLGAILKLAFENNTLTQVKTEPSIFAIGIITAFLSGVVAIRFLLRFVTNHSLKVFAYYRLILVAIVLLLLAIF